jgi:type II secretory pathway component PulK
MNAPRQQHGFALLLTLVLVLLAGVALAGLARRSSVRALESRDALEQLQRRWTVRTCRTTLLPRAELILDRAERGISAEGKNGNEYRNDPMPTYVVSCELSGMPVELRVTDEQARLNVNQILAEGDRGEAQSRLKALLREMDARAKAVNAVHLRPLVVGDDTPSQAVEQALLPLGGYSQIFEQVGPEQLLGENGSFAIHDAVTCWGDGRVSIRRAPDAVVRAVCEPSLGPHVVARVLSARERNPYLTLKSIRPNMDLKVKDAEILNRYLTDQSTCHGLWVTIEGRSRAWHALSVGISVPRARKAVTLDADEAKKKSGASTPPLKDLFECGW